MKRIWTSVDILPAAGGFIIALDGRPLKTPDARPMSVAFLALAEAVAAEWRDAGLQGAEIKPDDLPLTRLATTARDRIPSARPEIVAQLAAYGLNDLLCYPPDAPPVLAARANDAWRPWLGWADTHHGIRLLTGTGINPVIQPAGVLEKCVAVLGNFSDYHLAALGVTVPALGSLVLGLALAARDLTPEAACRLGLLEELFQAERWGEDGLAAGRRAAILADLSVCSRFMELCTV